MVIDPFCGCGTTIAAAQKLNRCWIGIDITSLAISLIRHRLADSFGKVATYEVIGEPVSLPDAVKLAQEDPYQFQWWTLGLVGARPVEQKKGADKGIDGRIYFHDEGAGTHPGSDPLRAPAPESRLIRSSSSTDRSVGRRSRTRCDRLVPTFVRSTICSRKRLPTLNGLPRLDSNGGLSSRVISTFATTRLNAWRSLPRKYNVYSHVVRCHWRRSRRNSRVRTSKNEKSLPPTSR